MKNHIIPKMQKTTLLMALFMLVSFVYSQNPGSTPAKKPAIALVDFDCTGYTINPLQVKQFVINELIRIQKYEVIDRHEIDFITSRDTLDYKGCFSRECLTNFGKKLKVDYMFTGDIIKVGDNINISLRLLNVSTGGFEKMMVKEFLLIEGNETMMIRVAMNEMFDLPNDAEMVKKLTVKADFDNSINNPYKLRLRSDGPRMGIVAYSGTTATIMQAKKNDGGFESAYPAMFQFGYQFEKQYLNEGNFQALFEFIPTVSGLDQSRFVPSITLLNGLRNNRNGWEFGIGPTIVFTKMANGFYDNTDKHEWHLESDQTLYPSEKFNITSRPDSRGPVTMVAGLVIAAGKTFKSGRMNIPVNAFLIPGKNGLRFGISFGWNGKTRYEANEVATK